MKIHPTRSWSRRIAATALAVSAVTEISTCSPPQRRFNVPTRDTRSDYRALTPTAQVDVAE